jgi:DNA (cytosine-5)-methyltransferase 1
MAPAEIKAARQRLGLTQSGLAEALRLGPNGERTVRRWEQGDVPVTGPASVAIELLLEKRG